MDKLDAPSRHLLAQDADAGSEAEVGILLRGRGAFTESQLDALRADGAEVRTVAGDVLSASVAPTSLPALARHDFVTQVQLSQPLRPEDGHLGAASFYDTE
ncbi:hypothetical protein ACI797_08915 [Geodermatophilus sp. SYSU D00691]